MSERTALVVPAFEPTPSPESLVAPAGEGAAHAVMFEHTALSLVNLRGWWRLGGAVAFQSGHYVRGHGATRSHRVFDEPDGVRLGLEMGLTCIAMGH